MDKFVNKSTIGFIGGGIMASIMIHQLYLKYDIVVYDVDPLKAKQLQKEYKIGYVNSIDELIEKCDLIVLAIKPQHLPSVISKTNKLLLKNKIIISILAGVTIKTLESKFSHQLQVVRAMPNAPGYLGEGVTAISYNNQVEIETKLLVEKIFSSMGKTIVLHEKQFDVFTAICGSGPAFVYLFIDAIHKGAIEEGFNHKESLQLISQTLIGAGKVIQSSIKSPEELIKSVCSEGGTTIEGITVLKERKFTEHVVEAIVKTTQKSKLLSDYTRTI